MFIIEAFNVYIAYMTYLRDAVRSPVFNVFPPSCKATLNGLPPELILSISDFLPLVDLTCLSLCSRGFFFVYKSIEIGWHRRQQVINLNSTRKRSSRILCV